MTAQEQLNRLTRRQHGLVTAKQAVQLGLGNRQVEDRMRRHHWLALRPGVYAIAGMPPTREQALLAVTLAVDGVVAVSHRSAAAMWGMKGVEEPEVVHVVTDLGRWARLDGVMGHRSGALFQEDLTRFRRIPVTSRARTVVDLSGELSLAQLGRVLDDALRRGLSLDAVRRCAGRLGPAPGRRTSLVHTLLAERLPGYDPGDSDLETRVLRLLVTAGQPAPRQQLRVGVGKRKFRLDLAYPDARVGIESTVGRLTAGSPPFTRTGNATPCWPQPAGWSPTSAPGPPTARSWPPSPPFAPGLHKPPGRDHGGVIKPEKGAARWGGACTARRTRRSRSRRRRGRRRGRTGPGSP